MISFKKFGERSLRFVAILLASAIFFIDLFFPGFNTGGILYQSLFILSLWIPSRQNNLLLAGLCTLYIVVGYWWRHDLFLEPVDLFSRSISVLGIWSITVVASRKDKFMELISGKERRLKSLIEERTQEDREKHYKKTQSLQMRLKQRDEEASDLRQRETVNLEAKVNAETETKAKTSFLTDMTSEVQAPMQGIIDTAILLADSPLDSVQRDHVYTIRSTCESLLSFTNDILDFSQLEAGNIKLEHAPFVLRHCMEDAFDAVVNRMVQKHIELSYNLDPRIPVTILSDELRIKQILNNLIGNAVRRSEAGEIVISAKLLEENDGGNMIFFSVQDSGPLFSSEEIENLFKAHHQGAGPGLYITEQLCGILGGKIWVENQERNGAVFQFAIPVQKAPNQEIPLQGKPWFIGKHALVVDDSEHVRRFLNHQLKNWGMQATVFSNGPEAIKWYADSQDCDVAIIDLDMPILDGLTLAHQIRQKDHNVPIILLTSLGSIVSDPTLATNLTKPLKQRSLYDQLNVILALENVPGTGFTEFYSVPEKSSSL